MSEEKKSNAGTWAAIIGALILIACGYALIPDHSGMAVAPLLISVDAWWDKVNQMRGAGYSPVSFELGDICEPCWLEREIVQPVGLVVEVEDGEPLVMCPHAGGGPQ